MQKNMNLLKITTKNIFEQLASLLLAVILDIKCTEAEMRNCAENTFMLPLLRCYGSSLTIVCSKGH